MVRMYTAEYFKRRRRKMRLSFVEVAGRLDCGNVPEAIRRIKVFERAGHADPAFLTGLATVLGIDERTQNRLAFDDYCSWFDLANMPIAPRLFRRASPDDETIPVPTRLKTDEARERFAADFARKCGTDVCLMLSARVRIWFAGDGSLSGIVEEVPDDIGETVT